MQFSDTPITDKAEAEGHGSVFNEVREAWKLCRKLETELHQAREMVNVAHTVGINTKLAACKKMWAKITELEKRLAEPSNDES